MKRTAALTPAAPRFVVLGSGDEHLLTSYIIGSAGSQVSLAAVVPELVASLWDAASSADWGRARAAHEQLYPLAVAIYRLTWRPRHGSPQGGSQGAGQARRPWHAAAA